MIPSPLTASVWPSGFGTASIPSSFPSGCRKFSTSTAPLRQGPQISIWRSARYTFFFSGFLINPPLAWPVGNLSSSRIQTRIPLFLASGRMKSRFSHHPGPQKSGWGRDSRQISRMPHSSIFTSSSRMVSLSSPFIQRKGSIWLGASPRSNASNRSICCHPSFFSQTGSLAATQMVRYSP